MFTGLIEAVGTIKVLTPERLEVISPAGFAVDIKLGESIAVNGCCLTVVDFDPVLVFDLSEETLRRTGFGTMKSFDLVNLERAMQLGARFGGHIVQGHVDATANVVSIVKQPASHIFRFAVDPQFDRYLIDKGSITIDGISLTVVEPVHGEFDTWIIPHTIEQTNLGRLLDGSVVNVEFDMIAKHIEKLVSAPISR